MPESRPLSQHVQIETWEHWSPAHTVLVHHAPFVTLGERFPHGDLDSEERHAIAHFGDELIASVFIRLQIHAVRSPPVRLGPIDHRAGVFQETPRCAKVQSGAGATRPVHLSSPERQRATASIAPCTDSTIE